MTNLDKVSNFIKVLIREKPAIEMGLERLRSHFVAMYPKLGIEPLRVINYENDLEGIKLWLIDLFNKHPLPNTVKSVWFGLFEKADGDGQSFCLYISGSKLTPDNDPSDWATDTIYFPEGRYYIPEGLNQLYQEIKKINNSDNISEIEVLVISSVTCLLLTHLLPQINVYLLKERKELFVGTGYDEGDIFILGKIAEHGWEKNEDIK